MPSTLHALLIGIDDYVPNRLPDGSHYPSLRGATGDVAQMALHLSEREGLRPETTRMLLSRNGPDGRPVAPLERLPTYVNIVAAFKQLAAEARSGDRVYIHYSGHGTRTPTEYPEIKVPGGQDEALVPCDIGDPASRYLRDLELAVLVRLLVDRGLQVTLVIDCCHAGGAMRGSRANRRAEAVARCVPWALRELTPSAVADPKKVMEIWKNQQGERHHLRGLTPQSWLPVERYALFAACRPSECAFEYPFEEGKPRGALTYWLIDTLVRSHGELSCGEIHQRLVERVRGFFASQTPMFIGDRQSGFLAATTGTQTNIGMPAAAKEGDRIHLDGSAEPAIRVHSKPTGEAWRAQSVGRTRGGVNLGTGGDSNTKVTPAMKNPIEFELKIAWAGERCWAKVCKSPVGKGASCWFDLPTEFEVEELYGDPESFPFISRYLTIEPRPRLPLSVKYFGQNLFESVFIGPVLEAWRASVATARDDLLLRLRLENNPRLLRVPWELLFDPQTGVFIATERRFVRSLDVSVEIESLRVPIPLRILVVLSCPRDMPTLNTRQEWAILDKMLGDKVDLRVVSPRLEEINRALRSGVWQLFHFVGHGETDDEGGSLFLEGQDGDAHEVDHLRLGTVLSHPALRLVVLNACEGARPGRSNEFSGVAQAIVREKVPAVVAMQQPISDAAAISFAKAFYRALAEGGTVAEAVWRAREDLFRDNEEEWSIPVLYLQGLDGPLIKVPPPTSFPLWRRIIAMTTGQLLKRLGLAIWRRPNPER